MMDIMTKQLYSDPTIKPLREPVVIIPVNSMDQNCGLINKTNNRSFNLKAVLNRIPIDREKSRYLEKVV
ncbi:hypothetical protein KQX54_000502 [Cotesia glomerata]|uniref:Uncharacterized protein n=1 Tax=Cotesia glomerata TaxID=32391 RepID=A0AAV7IXR8_COTGL|nr:hypothetical protein KQX54_000502 [Cotesia glomerata]